MATIMAQPQLLTQLMRELRALRCASWCRPSRRRRRGCGSIVDDASDWIAMLIALHLPAADAMPQIHVPAFDAVHLSAIDVVPQHILCFDPVGHEHYHKDTDAQAALTLAVGGTAAIVGVVLRYFIDTDDGGGASKCYGRADRVRCAVVHTPLSQLLETVPTQPSSSDAILPLTVHDAGGVERTYDRCQQLMLDRPDTRAAVPNPPRPNRPLVLDAPPIGQPRAAGCGGGQWWATHPHRGRRYDFFINHCQASGQDQCKTLCLELERAGATVWYDMEAHDLTASGMKEAVSQSRVVLMFLSDNLMGRRFCNEEQRWAKHYGCAIVGVHEKDERHNPADFSEEKERAPEDLKHLLDDVEFIEYRRRGFEAQAMVQELLRRGGVATTQSGRRRQRVSP